MLFLMDLVINDKLNVDPMMALDEESEGQFILRRT